MEAEASHQRTKCLKYKKLNTDFSKKKTSEEDTIILDDTLDSKSSVISEAHNFYGEDEKYTSPTAYNLLKMTKAAAAPLAATGKFYLTVTEMHLSLIN